MVSTSRMTTKRQGWVFRLLPVQRPTSVMASSSASVSGSSVNSRTWRCAAERSEDVAGRGGIGHTADCARLQCGRVARAARRCGTGPAPGLSVRRVRALG